MTSTFNRFFSISSFHEYFRGGKGNALEITPTEDTKEIFKGARIMWRRSGNDLLTLIRDNGSNQPYLNIHPAKNFRAAYRQVVFRFYISVKDPLFFNYTNIPLQSGTARKFYFSNLAVNEVNGMLNLSKPVAAHQVGADYFPGDMVSRSGTVYENIATDNSSTVANLSNAAIWVEKGLRFQSLPVNNWLVARLYNRDDLVTAPGTSHVFKALQKHVSVADTQLADIHIWEPKGDGELQYVSQSDLVETTTRSIMVDMGTTVDEARIKFFEFNYDEAAPAYNLQVGETVTQLFETGSRQVALDFSGMKPGKYLAQINDTITKTVYYDPEFGGSNILGVVEIFNHIADSSSYSLLDGDEEFNKPDYAIQFANRRVIWKYIAKDGRAQSIKDASGASYEFVTRNQQFVSPTLLPLAEVPPKIFELSFGAGGGFKMNPLPGPGVQSLAKCNLYDYDTGLPDYNYFCSEIFLNY